MNITGPVPDLTPRAVEQLTSLGIDVHVGYQRLRAVNATRNKLRSQLYVLGQDLEREKRELQRHQQAGASIDALTLRHASFKETSDQLDALVQRIGTLDREYEAIRSWHDPAARMVTTLVEALGFKSIEQVLPDFSINDGIDLETLQQHATAGQPQAFGGAR